MRVCSWVATRSAVAIFAAVAFANVPASAAYCGKPANTAAIERLVLAADRGDRGFNRSYIIAIQIVGEIARAAVALKGEQDLYFERSGTSWRRMTAREVLAVPAAVSALFLVGEKHCENPRYVQRPSG
jgi:hypothetical protein